MANFEGVSCELCLRADEPESMLNVPIPHALHNPARVAVFCPDCMDAIMKYLAAASAAAADEEKANAAAEPPEESDRVDQASAQEKE